LGVVTLAQIQVLVNIEDLDLLVEDSA